MSQDAPVHVGMGCRQSIEVDVVTVTEVDWKRACFFPALDLLVVLCSPPSPPSLLETPTLRRRANVPLIIREQ